MAKIKITYIDDKVSEEFPAESLVIDKQPGWVIIEKEGKDLLMVPSSAIKFIKRIEETATEKVQQHWPSSRTQAGSAS